MTGPPPAMTFHVLSIFPEMLEAPLGASIIGKAIDRGLIEVHLHQIRDHTTDRHRSTDDTPYGGGAGMVMKPEPLVRAIRWVKQEHHVDRSILLSAAGGLFSQRQARRLAGNSSILLICGRYEGVDERVKLLEVDEEISVGDYVLSGGEPAALVVVDAVSRLVPGVLGNIDSLQEESHSSGLLEYPQYTRPREYEGHEVPEVLLSGDHARIARWRRRLSLLRTRTRRPELFIRYELSDEDLRLLEEGGDE